ncbi:hypothetical protein DVA86_27280 [Streptomyces armeniacus]|uniref:Uncharacterized protein n=1 Tax=Streptomyces armeniacus TaxID=83291 RepID=A0A345XVW7_9ACTN|nr:hypothetical protein [Streptomyces armeniacus]AXK35783.1 hypothetical protein DVA86_27280 [Streptomyces armeniacus]
MITPKNRHTLSDGLTICFRAVDGIIGTAYREVQSRPRKASSLLCIDGHMYGVFGPRGDLVPVQHADYAYAATNAEGARKALAFFIEAAESCIKHAAEQGVPVEECYGGSE